MTYLPPASNDIEWSKLSMDVVQPCSHIECHYLASTREWSEPRIVQDPYVKVHTWATGLHFGQQCFEGLKSFRTSDDRVLVFRPEDHARRLIYSASHVALPAPPTDLFIRCVDLAILSNSDFVPPHDVPAVFYIRPLLFGNGPRIPLAPTLEATFCVLVQPALAYHGYRPVDALIMDDFDRAAPKGVGGAKLGGNYSPTIPHAIRALQQGFPITLHLDSKTRREIEEFSTCAFIGVRRDGEETTLVVPDSSNVVQSITSDCCLSIAKGLGWHTEKRVLMNLWIKYEELAEFNEVFAAGTAVSLLPIRSITCHSTSDKFEYVKYVDRPGSVFETLSKVLADLQRGVIADEYGWTRPVGDTRHDENSTNGTNGHSNGIRTSGKQD